MWAGSSARMVTARRRRSVAVGQSPSGASARSASVMCRRGATYTVDGEWDMVIGAVSIRDQRSACRPLVVFHHPSLRQRAAAWLKTRRDHVPDPEPGFVL